MLEDPKTGYYSPGQIENLYPFLEGVTPQWLLLGGPGSASEAQDAVKKWPRIRVIGVEPNPAAVSFQRRMGWPEGEPLVEAALWENVATVPMTNLPDDLCGGDLLHASVYHPVGENDKVAGSFPRIPAVTWDKLDVIYGPFAEAILWMDIEGSELEALRGAEKLFQRGAIRIANLELTSRPQTRMWEVKRMYEVDKIMTRHGFRHKKDWNDSDWCRDRIYLLEN